MVAVVLGLFVTSGAQAAMSLTVGTPSTAGASVTGGDTITNSGLSDFLDTYNLVLDTDMSVRIAGTYSDIIGWSGNFDLIKVETVDNAANPVFGLVGYNGSIASDWHALAAGTYSIIVDGVSSGLGEYAFTVSAVPIPAAVWLFGSALIGFAAVGFRNRA